MGPLYNHVRGVVQEPMPTKSLLSRLTGPLLDLLLPPFCAVCEREGSFLCADCEGALPRLRQPYCNICSSPGSPGMCHWCAAGPLATDGIRAPYLMEGSVRELVYRLKYRNLRVLAPDLGRLLREYLVSHPIAADVIIPVPLHRRRQRERGYNQSELLARELGALTGVAVDKRALRRTRNAPPQVSIDGHEERRQNVEGAFECTTSLDGTHVLLIDDVVTTGSTMSACASALKNAGASSVWGLVFARQGSE